MSKSISLGSNEHISYVTPFVVRCTHCGHEDEISEASLTCLQCGVQRFVKMNAESFTKLFKETLLDMNIPADRVNAFITKRNIPIQDIGICVQLGVLIDRVFELKFGGQYQSFLVRENFRTITKNNL